MTQGLRVNTPLSHYDIYETLLDYAGLNSSDTSGPGHSFANILQAEAMPALTAMSLFVTNTGPRI